MNNKPVAWMYERPNGSAKLTFVREPMAGTVITETPLYNHPAKTLTDEEIKKVLLPFLMPQVQPKYPIEPFNYIDFARAILRKAQEK